MTIEELKNQIASVEEASQRDSGNSDFRTQYLGKNGVFNQLAKALRELPSEERPAAGQLLNTLRETLEERAAAVSATGVKNAGELDLTLPAAAYTRGHLHPTSQAIEEIIRIFERIGFSRARYPEVDWDWYVFEALNMPPEHPARDEWETFFVDVPDMTDQSVQYDANNPRTRHPSLIGGKMVLTTHTSNGQIHEMERVSEPPIRMINIGRCYRRQQDATHTQMFHQFEGLVVDRGINIQHLKGTLDYFATEFYGPGTKSRIRPFHFRFTEPSFEVDFSCHLCEGTGLVDGTKCKFCKSGWHEVGGAGMVHPNVLRAGGIDPEQYTGFAFGWGVERTYTLKADLNIDDIRLLYSNDLRFLEQF